MTKRYLRLTAAAFAAAVLPAGGCGDKAEPPAEVKSRPANLQVEKPGAKNAAKTPGGRLGNSELSKPVNPSD